VALKHYIIKNLDCPDCAQDIEGNLRKMGQTRYASVNYATAKLTFDTESPEDAFKEIKSLHPDITFEEITGRLRKEKPDVDMIRHIVILSIAGICYLLGLLFQKQLSATYFQFAEYAVFIFAFLIAGYSVLFSAFKNMIKGKFFDENFLMSIATIGAIVIHQLPEAVGVMIFYKTGLLLQNLSLARSRRSISSLAELKPEYAHRVSESGVEDIHPEIVGVNEKIIVKPGERIPLDGDVETGSSQVDTSALSGESMPKLVGKGDPVFAGMINKTATLTLRVTNSFGESYISRILTVTENAMNKKAKTEQFITKFARYYTPFVLLSAIIIACISPLIIAGMTVSQSVYRALVLLVMSCPCALVLSIPLGYYGGIGKASRNGILVKGSNYLDILTQVKTVVFDKTGTITKGNFKVQDIVPANGYSKQKLIEYAVMAESHSRHPIATSLFDYYGSIPNPSLVKRYEEKAGEGVIAYIENHKIVAGNDRLLHTEGLEHECCVASGTTVHMGIDEKYAGYIVISDEVKDDSAEAVSGLKKLGVDQIDLFTGDSECAASGVARSIGFDHYYSELLPHEKAEKIDELIKNAPKKHKIAFVGDGINDAPSLARSDVGIAMGEFGTEAAIDTADIVLSTDSPSKVAVAIKIAWKTKRLVIENIVFALGIKLLFIVLGVVGIAGMWEAVFADMGVSLLAIFNAMRILR
jgi:Cd2+/Zn2+-exporting ATPase